MSTTFLLNMLLISAFAGAVSSVLVYHLTAYWWTNYIGRHTMAFMVALVIILAQSVIVRFWPTMPGQMMLAWFNLLLLNGILWWRMGIFLRAYHENRRRQREMETVND